MTSKYFPVPLSTSFDKTTYFYDDVKNATEIDYPGGVAKAFLSYKPITHRLMEMKNLNFRGEVISSFGLGQDADGNVTSTTTAFGTAAYLYDSLQQLKSGTFPAGSAAYHYDLAGNRDSVTENGVTKFFNYNNANQLLPTSAFPYDNNGNQLGKNISGPFGTSCSWDALNRLVQVHKQAIPSDPLVVSNYVYNGDNLRVKKAVGTVVTNYLFDGLQVLAETDASGNTKTLFNPGISVTDNKGNKYFYLWDGHGDVANLIDKDGNIVDAYSYDPFGKTTGVTKNSNGSRYVGLLDVFSDDDSGLLYMWNRWYDPDLGRFLNRDPLGLAGGDLNLYRYAANNPLTKVDPFGLYTFIDVHTGGVGHINIGTSTGGSSNYGLYPREELGLFTWSVQAQVVRQKRTNESIVLNTTPEQERAIDAAIHNIDMAAKNGTYKYWIPWGACTGFVADVLAAAGIQVPNYPFPEDLGEAIKHLPIALEPGKSKGDSSGGSK
jgi:RHS repeat-associated protein